MHHLLTGEPPGVVERLVITASGGPFRGRTRDELADVTVEQALKHPTWSMGGKITIDSATLMNKGLELMEAHHLFGTPYDRIDVVVHPQSIIHALVAAVRRLDAGAPGLSRHARGDRLRAAPPGPRRPADRAARPRRAGRAGLRGARPRRVPVPAPGPRGGASPAAPRRARSTPPTRSPCTPSSTGRLGFTGIPARDRAACSSSSAPSRVHDFEALYVTDSEAPRARPPS